MNERTLTAMFDTKGAAESARDEVVALGVPSSDVQIRSAEGGAAATDTTVGEDKGFWASLADAIFPDEDRYTYAEGMRRGGYILTARAPYDIESQVLEAIERHEPVDLDERTESWRQGGWAGYEGQQGVVTERTTTTTDMATGTTAGLTGKDYGRTDATTTAATTSTTTQGYADTTGASAGGLGAATVRSGRDEDTVEVAEEELRVGKREVGRGKVRVRSYVTERPVEEQVNLREERVEVERRPVNRAVEPGDAVFQEKVIEATERGEEAVVEKQARVVEEVGIKKDVDTRTETVRDTVRKQEVEVEDGRTAAAADRTTATGLRDESDATLDRGTTLDRDRDLSRR